MGDVPIKPAFVEFIWIWWAAALAIAKQTNPLLSEHCLVHPHSSFLSTAGWLPERPARAN